MRITQDKLMKTAYKRLEREYNKILKEGRPMPAIWFRAYDAGVQDIIFDLGLWRKFHIKYNKKIGRLYHGFGVIYGANTSSK